MNPSDQYVIQTQNLSKTFGEVQALKSLDLAVPKYSIVGFLGPNGAGKTTTIRLLLGLNRPTSGRGTIFGFDIVEDSVEIRKRVGYLAQNPRFYDDMTAREILRFTAHFFFKGPESKIEARIDEMLELVNLEDKADRKIKGFSGGERQRLGIAQAQINDWVLSKPASRSAFYLSKLIANLIGMLVVMILAPCAVAYALVAIVDPGAVPLPAFLAGVGMLALHIFFYLSLTLLMGVLASSREMVLGVTLGTLFIGMIARDFIGPLALLTPWLLSDLAGVVAIGEPIGLEGWLPVISTAAWSFVFTAIALWRFRQHEF